ncbi:MAG: peptidoglycan DD-metalloendopeptidase family protein [Cellvibrionaceae bacterium]|nr:peptidoglycan DD-metalloendopeptidase family protein [Cellvibrionaceae bacterium]
MFNILIILFCLPHCYSGSNRAPISSVQSPDKHTRHVHRVKAGETLYAIAWRYGLDYKRLATANGIDGNYRIFPGQKIILKGSAPQVSPLGSAAKGWVVTPKAQQKLTVSAPVKSKTRAPLKTSSTSIASSVQVSSRSEKKSTVAGKLPATPAKNKTLNWQWPSAGKVFTNFNGAEGVRKGIDIRGEKGDSVVAAAAGEIVYAGSGLRGYGKLVIIKHNEVYLSAYAHNDQIRVREGEFVTVGQHIATIGSSGTGARNKPLLHFQIRRNGKPVDPLKVLPKRKS